MITIRKANDRGLTQIEWLESYHSFSFGEYYDPNFMGFGDLRVINEDRVQPGEGFGAHSHQNMEIISYVIDGALAHKDSMGTGSIIQHGEIQRMSAGSGVKHSEFNHSKKDNVHFLQMWITPADVGLEPSYEQKKIPMLKDKLILIGSPKGGEHAVIIHQDVLLFVGFFSKGNDITHDLKGSKGWLQVIKGEVSLNDKGLNVGDGAAIANEKHLNIKCMQDAEFLLFDLK